MRSPGNQTLYSAFIFVFCFTSVSITASDDFTVSSFRSSAVLAAGGYIEVVNPLGDIRIRNSNSGDLGVSAIIQNLKQNQSVPEVGIVETGSGYDVNVIYKNGEKAFDGRVDLTLLVTKPTTVEATTTFGNVYARYAGDLKVTTDSGNLSIDTKGEVDAQTGSGSILAWAAASEPAAFTSEKGSITVKVPSPTPGSIRAVTGGEIITLPANVSGATVSRQGNKNQWTLNIGDPAITIESVSGDINIHLSQTTKSSVSHRTAPVVVNKHLKDLSKAEEWSPGQAIKEIPRN